MPMEIIMIVFIKLMGAAISGHWAVSTDCATLRDPGTSRDYDVLVRQTISTASGLRRRCSPYGVAYFGSQAPVQPVRGSLPRVSGAGAARTG